MDPGILAIVAHTAHAVAATLGTITATWSRGTAAAQVPVTLTSSAAWLQSPDEGIATRIHQTRFLFDPAALDLGNGPTDPAAGDAIAFDLNGYTYRFEVRPPQDGQPCATPADPLRARLYVSAVLTAKTPTSSSSSSPSP